MFSDNFLPYKPQIENPDNNFITDTLNWQLIRGTFKAKGGEQYLTIGNFRDSASMIMSSVYGDTLYSSIYFHIDEVELVEAPYRCEIPNVYSPNGDNRNDEFTLNIINIIDWSCKIFNRWGIKVAELSEKNNSWDGYTTAGEKCSEDIYYYIFSAKITEKMITEKGFIQLLR